MRETYSEALAQVLKDEGGYTSHPKDPGGPTNWGITIHDARTYWKPDATASDVRRLPLSVARDIYRKRYADVIQYDKLPAGVDYAVLDYGINSGVSRAAKVLQRIVGATPIDGKIGLVTLTKTSEWNAAKLINAIYDERLRFLRNLKTWPVFGKGWGARCKNGRSLALDLARRYPRKLEVIEEPPAETATPAELEPIGGSAKAPPEIPDANPPAKSRTIWGGVLAWLGGVSGSIFGMFEHLATPWGFAALVFIVAVISVGLYLVIKGRLDVQKVVKRLTEEVEEAEA